MTIFEKTTALKKQSDDVFANRLCAKKIGVTFQKNAILHQLNIDIPDRKVSIIIGPNACGKSTLLRSLARLQSLSSGQVLLDGKNIRQHKTRAVAQQLAILPQISVAPEGIRVVDLVSRGRTPYQSALSQWSQEDTDKVTYALEVTGMSEFAERPLESLSGGQRQRAWIAMSLAQDTDLLLLDEPTTFLDLPHQIEVLQLSAKLNREQQRTIVMVLHDINLAARYGDHLIAMKDGAIYAQGSPDEVINQRTIKQIFGLDCHIIRDPSHGTPHVIPF
jgi:iron complex transport system ATP-binding protein